MLAIEIMALCYFIAWNYRYTMPLKPTVNDKIGELENKQEESKEGNRSSEVLEKKWKKDSRYHRLQGERKMEAAKFIFGDKRTNYI